MHRTALRRLGPSSIPFIAVVALYAIGALTREGFSTWPSTKSLLVIGCFLALACIGQTYAIILGGIDLSIPGVIGLADVVTTRLYGDGVGFGWIMLIVFGFAAVIGALNGLLAQLLRTHTLIVTLASGSIISGGVFLYTQGNNSGSVPPWLTDAVSPAGNFLGTGLPAIVIMTALVTLIAIGIQRYTVLGRRMYAIGANSIAARFALLRPTLTWSSVFALSSIGAALAGVALAGFSGGADPSVGQPYLFTTVAAVVVGGTSLIGGRGGYGRTIAGVLIITLLTTLLLSTGVSSVVQQIFLGVLIVIMVGVYGRGPELGSQV